MDIDIILEPDLTPTEIKELGVVAEDYGIRALWTSNYFSHWDGFLSLVPLAEATSKLKFGPLAVSPLEMHPLKIANTLLTLNELSNGRAQIAVGAGEGNITAMGLQVPEKIVLAVRESIEIILAACKNQLQDLYHGEIFSVNFPCDYSWAKSSRPIVYGTAYRHMMMRMEGRVADGVYIGATPPEIIDSAIENIKIGISRRVKADQNVHINSFWAWHIKRDREEAYRESRRELAWRARKLESELLGLYLNPQECKLVEDNFQSFVDAYFDRSGNIKNIPGKLANRLCEVLTSTGGLEDLDKEIERFKRFEEAGQTQLSLRLHDDPIEALTIIGEHVLPAFTQ